MKTLTLKFPKQHQPGRMPIPSENPDRRDIEDGELELPECEDGERE